MSPFMHGMDPERWLALPDGFSAGDPEETRIPISQYVWICRRHRWRILGFCAAAVLLTVIVSARLTPIYESTTTVDVDRETPSGVVGQEASRSVTNDAEQFLATQMKLVQSDGVLRPVDERLQLRLKEKQASAVSPRGEAAPIVLKRLRVTRPPNTYLMLISYRSDDPVLAADAANAIADSYLEHSYDIRMRGSTSLTTFMERQLDGSTPPRGCCWRARQSVRPSARFGGSACQPCLYTRWWTTRLRAWESSRGCLF